VQEILDDIGILVQHFSTKDLIATMFIIDLTQRITEVENNIGVVSEHFNLNQLENVVAYADTFNDDIYVSILLYLLNSCLTL
jgi:hypothetical protein